MSFAFPEFFPEPTWTRPPMTVHRGFDELLLLWRTLLGRHMGPAGALRWVLRENLFAGDEPGDPSVSVHFQCLDPALSSSDVARVFERERAHGGTVHFELVAAQPEALVVSLRRAPTWARHRDLGQGITMQVEPSFHSFVEVSSREDWRALRQGHARDGALELLEAVLPASPSRAPSPRTGT